MPTTVVPCKRPKVTVEPRPDGREFLVTCHVPGCGWHCPEDLQFVACKFYAEEEATRHRRQHRDAVPATTVTKIGEKGGFTGQCACGHKPFDGALTSRDSVERDLEYHLHAAHGLVTCP